MSAGTLRGAIFSTEGDLLAPAVKHAQEHGHGEVTRRIAWSTGGFSTSSAFIGRTPGKFSGLVPTGSCYTGKARTRRSLATSWPARAGSRAGIILRRSSPWIRRVVTAARRCPPRVSAYSRLNGLLEPETEGDVVRSPSVHRGPW